jgi:hypothetical protein
MPSVLLDYVIGSPAKRPFVRNVWGNRNTTKRGYRIRSLDSPGFYKPLDALMFNSGFQPMYGLYTGTQHLAVRNTTTGLVSVNNTTVGSNPMFGSADSNTWTVRNLPTGNHHTSIIAFSDKIWVFTKASTYLSTDLTATSWTTGASTPVTAGGLYKPVIFGGRIVACGTGQLNTIYSTINGSSFSTHTLPGTIQVTGMTTDGTTLIVVGYTTVGSGYVYKTTDLTNWTLMSVKLTASDSEMSGLVTTTASACFSPLGITFTNGIFVIVASDVMLSGGSINSYLTSGYRFYTGTSAGPFLLKSEVRAEGNNLSHVNKCLFNNLFGVQGRTSHCITVDANGRIAMGAALHNNAYVDTTTYYGVSPCIIYSDDYAETWTISDITGKEVMGSLPVNSIFTPTCIYPSPNGFVVFFGNYDTPAPDFYMVTNPNARELVMPY